MLIEEVMLIERLIGEHRRIEKALDALGQPLDIECFRHVRGLISQHYEQEEAFLRKLDEQGPALAAKVRAQHAEALEIAASLEDSLREGQTRDIAYLARRLLAIVQHNIIEEERDVFPLFAP